MTFNIIVLQLWEQQKAIEEAAAREAREAAEAREARERHERHERDRMELLRKKDKHEHSANASTQVKQKLQVPTYLYFTINYCSDDEVEDIHAHWRSDNIL